MSGPADPFEDDSDLLAGEYVLGMLPPEQARALEALALQDQTIADSIALWQDRLAPLALAVEPRSPPPVLWRRLALATGIDSVIARRARRGENRAWRSPGLWRATTVLSLALAASLAFLLLTRPQPVGQPLLAALAPAGAPAAVFLVRVDADGRATVIAAGNPALPAGRALELWALRAGATAPQSLGLIPVAGQRQLILPDHAGTQLLVSQEPAGGSPTGQPTGPVVYQGTLTGA